MKGRKTGGRVKGVPNKLTVVVKEAFELAFQGIGGVETLTAWAKENPTEFFKLFARLIPVDVKIDTTVRPLTYAERRAQEDARDSGRTPEASLGHTVQ